jgi:DNA-binding NtrC family response regulator
VTTVLVVDDEPLQAGILRTILEKEGYDTHTAASGKEALARVADLRPDVILTDLRMEGMDGIELIAAVPREPFEPSMIIMTAHGTIASAVDAVRKGAFDYLAKPLDKDTLLLTVRRAAERAALLKENLRLRDQLFGRVRMEGIVGRSAKMAQALEMLRKIAPSPATVLVRGESGTGKELVARAIHFNSPRKKKPFTPLNCSAIPEQLFESELFGHERGAFTGAESRKEGLFELSQGGTLFLDEIGDLPLLMQAKLLRALQDKEVRRVGGKESIKVDVRVVAATNKDLEKEMAEGRFREDLYYRLAVVTVDLPPLRERREDIPELVEYFVQRYNREYGKRIAGVSPAVLRAFAEYSWPGNIRQLSSVMERAVLLCEGGTIGEGEIRGELRLLPAPAGVGAAAAALEIPDEGLDFEALEKELLRKAMEKAGGVATKAAKLLGMSYKTFLYRLEKFGLG